MKLCCLAAALFVTTTAFAASPWDGTWKLNRAKSHLTGETYSWTKLPDGMWESSFGKLKIKFAPDGKPYPVFDQDHTMSVTLLDARTLKTVNMVKGKVTSTETDTLSADGKTLSAVITGTRPDGSSYTNTETDTRVGAGEGFFGTWMSAKVGSSSDTPGTITTTATTISFVDPATKFSITAKLDGTPATPVSPEMTAGVTISYKKVSPTRIDYTVMLNGKVVTKGYDELAADGKSYTEVNWLVGNESEKTTRVYDKQ
jgi:hypothetical protein